MTAKEYLQRLRKISIQIENKKKQLCALQDNITYLQGIDYSKDKVQTSPSDSLSNAVVKLVDLENELVEAIMEHSALYDDYVCKINGMSRREYIQILFARYIDRKKFEEISCEIGYSYYRTCRMHGEALDEFEKKYLRN